MLFVPPWPRNPYQERLAEALSRVGVGVSPCKRGRLQHPVRLLRGGVDVVHLHSAAALIRDARLAGACSRALRVLAALTWLRLRGVTVVWTAHDLEDHDRARPRLEYAFTWVLARIASGILCHGEEASRQVTRRFHLSAARHPRAMPLPPYDAGVVIPRAEARQRLLPGVAPDDVVFLFLGSIKEYRGVDDLVAAFTRIARPGLHLVVRGPAKDPEVAQRLERAASQPGIDIAFGFVPESDISAWMAAADVVTAPYRRILTSGSVALAASHERPVVAPRMGAIPETVGDGGGLLYDPGDPDGLERALLDAIDARDALPDMGKHALQHIERFSWDDAARETAGCYRAWRGR